MKKVKLPLILAVCLLIAAAGIPKGIHAYFADRDSAGNTFSIGVNRIEPEEPFDPPSPGKRTVKKPMVRNTGNIDCYVRCQILLSDSRAGEHLTYYYGEEPGMNDEDWVPAADGWRYLKNALAPGELSAPVFEEILLSTSIPEELSGFTIDVVYESVQTEGYANAAAAFAAVAAR